MNRENKKLNQKLIHHKKQILHPTKNNQRRDIGKFCVEKKRLKRKLWPQPKLKQINRNKVLKVALNQHGFYQTSIE